MYEYVQVPKATDKSAAILSEAFLAALRAPSPMAATPALMKVLGTTFGAKRAYIYQLPPGESEFRCTCEWCAPGVEPMSDVTHGLTKDMAARWFGDGEAKSLLVIRSVEDIATISPEYASLFVQRNTKQQVIGKLMRGKSPMGTLGFDDPSPELIDELCDVMYPICAFATSTVNTQNLLGRMSSIGVVDKLTGAGTRIAFYQQAERLPSHLSIGMAYLDIAGMQGVNDERGHRAGDELLVAVRQALITEFQDDQVYRMGGDEFLVAVQGLDEQTFRDAMARIRKRLDEFSVYIAMGVGWQDQLGTDYDVLVRHVWLACSNDKQEWERQGGTRPGEDTAFLMREFRQNNPGASEDVVGHLNLSCYHSDEFFHRANIWARHLETRRIVMIALDINYFKLYNDIYGREAGDLLLETYARGIVKTAIARRGVAGYLNGDNFAMVFGLPDAFDENMLTAQLKLEFGKYDVAEGFSPSVGVVVTENRNIGMSILYDRALIAMQEVKGNYTDHIAFYDERRYERERDNQLMLINAKDGLARGEFTFFLQPKVDIATNKIVSAEALVRWIHDGQIIAPYKFVGLMEQSGYIFALDRYVWDSVCAWQRSLLDRGIEPVPVSVNVSRADFHFTDLATHFSSLIRKYDIPARLIGIEVTESAYSKDTLLINDVIRRMQQEGFLVFMDDFGSGYSSLNMLRSVTVDVLKMDKGFIDHAQIHDGSDAIIVNVIKMAHMMGLPVISEGVETEEQRNSLRNMDCDYVQGYYYYRPMPKDKFEKLLREHDIVELGHSDNVILALGNSTLRD